MLTGVAGDKQVQTIELDWEDDEAKLDSSNYNLDSTDGEACLIHGRLFGTHSREAQCLIAKNMERITELVLQCDIKYLFRDQLKADMLETLSLRCFAHDGRLPEAPNLKELHIHFERDGKPAIEIYLCVDNLLGVVYPKLELVKFCHSGQLEVGSLPYSLRDVHLTNLGEAFEFVPPALVVPDIKLLLHGRYAGHVPLTAALRACASAGFPPTTKWTMVVSRSVIVTTGPDSNSKCTVRVPQKDMPNFPLAIGHFLRWSHQDCPPQRPGNVGVGLEFSDIRTVWDDLRGRIWQTNTSESRLRGISEEYTDRLVKIAGSMSRARAEPVSGHSPLNHQDNDVLSTALVIVVTLAAGAIARSYNDTAALPAPGRLYHIVNQETGLRFDISGSHSEPRTPVLGYPPNEGDNQKGNGLTAETFKTGFNVTEFGSATGFTITIPLTNPLLAVTTTTDASQLTLEVRDATNNLQVWTFQEVA
ncbi:hypothetical protein AURDEDRAFT_130842 [Auricularia subglabra TFB-10046 SS5]|uniref:Uncharacterized protein n=1 Tax=Auricularia subglabra (strain TFB-10046 / SS5) TaxID=717982 RepID=J0CWN2_AURST|nr:hypothetical protein AURDEDRAFT_130842 [Auricularia subglabra TFB-10046 SS5]